ncbi:MULTISPECIES: hypothetical protein [Haloferax]|uniref:Uncharacterized protein n=2 Tax=Haloferax TaxID=2251 RepID=A0A6G1Z7A3_9EURY|nr:MULTISPECIES: hypothetical protein [Haloferax]KAB1184791.1 hypothetical protein Hfx1149_17150 [Haloferax sp. CBA1149]MRW82422.1 hypothetical protein [Haloferax marinisediminis]
MFNKETTQNSNTEPRPVSLPASIELPKYRGIVEETDWVTDFSGVEKNSRLTVKYELTPEGKLMKLVATEESVGDAEDVFELERTVDHNDTSRVPVLMPESIRFWPADDPENVYEGRFSAEHVLVAVRSSQENQTRWCWQHKLADAADVSLYQVFNRSEFAFGLCVLREIARTEGTSKRSVDSPEEELALYDHIFEALVGYEVESAKPSN